jgi:hypothetical protein
MSTLFQITPHGFSLVVFIKHLFFDSIADGGGYYASRFCKHTWHRVSIAVSFALVTTFALVTLVG